MKRFFNSTLALILCAGLCSFIYCSNNREEPKSKEEILLLSTNPEENSMIDVATESISFVFNKGVYIADVTKITLNGISMPHTTAYGATLTIKLTSLKSGTSYELVIDKGAIRDGENHLNSSPFSLTFKTSDIMRFEAENALFSADRAIVDDAGCSGGKYVETRESNLTFSFSVSKEGNYKIIAKARSFDGEKVNTFRFDGEHTLDITFPQNNLFNEVVVIDPYYLSTGNHTIEMIKIWGWIHFDYLEILPSTAPPVEFVIDPLVTSQPSPNTAKLYHFLRDNFQSRIISGTMTLKSLSTVTGEHQNEISWLYEKTGKKPALLGLDFMDHTGSLPPDWRNNPDIIQDALTWHQSNGIVALCWHWRDPSQKTYEFYTEGTSFDSRKIFEPQSEEYAAMMHDMNVVADYLKELQDKDVPVLWRPLHEASGRWFWWGAQGPDACKQIWQIMFDKFTNEHHLNNLIWVWTSEANNNALLWYPGDEYVDIIGLDVYDEGNHGSQMLAFESLKRIFKGKKMLALSECGSIPFMEAMKKEKTVWSYYMPWYGTHTKSPLWNSVNDWTLSLSDPDVITLDNM